MVSDNDAIGTSNAMKVLSVPLEANMAVRKIVCMLYLYIHQTNRKHADKAAGANSTRCSNMGGFPPKAHAPTSVAQKRCTTHSKQAEWHFAPNPIASPVPPQQNNKQMLIFAGEGDL